jgi:hypothetical protein
MDYPGFVQPCSSGDIQAACAVFDRAAREFSTLSP